MSNSFKGFMIFVLGAGCGAVASYFYVKKKIVEQANARADEEIASVREAYTKRSTEVKPSVLEYAHSIQSKESGEESTTTSAYSELTKKYKVPDFIDYTRFPVGSSEPSPEEEDDEESDEEESVSEKPAMRKYREPYVITPDSFGEVDYDIIGLTYYNDGVLTDDDDEPISDVEGTVGFDALRHFGDEDGAMVYVRNERLKCDYEIAFDKRKYKELKRRKPHQVED